MPAAQMKWMVRADCRPPNTSSSKGKAAFMAGDMVRPVSTISGKQRRRSPPGRRASAARCSASPPRPWGSGSERARRPTAPMCRSCWRVGARSRRTWPLHAAIDEVDEAVEHEQPGEEEVPAAPRGEVAIGGQRDPAGKAAILVFAASIPRKAEHAGRVELRAADGGDAAIAAVGLFHGTHAQHGAVEARTSRRNRASDGR